MSDNAGAAAAQAAGAPAAGHVGPPPSHLQRVLELLRGPTDERRFVGLHLVAKLPPATGGDLLSIFRAVGPDFLARLLAPADPGGESAGGRGGARGAGASSRPPLETPGEPSGGGPPPASHLSDQVSLALAVWSTLAQLPEASEALCSSRPSLRAICAVVEHGSAEGAVAAAAGAPALPPAPATLAAADAAAALAWSAAGGPAQRAAVVEAGGANALASGLRAAGVGGVGPLGRPAPLDPSDESSASWALRAGCLAAVSHLLAAGGAGTVAGGSPAPGSLLLSVDPEAAPALVVGVSRTVRALPGAGRARQQASRDALDTLGDLLRAAARVPGALAALRGDARARTELGAALAAALASVSDPSARREAITTAADGCELFGTDWLLVEHAVEPAVPEEPARGPRGGEGAPPRVPAPAPAPPPPRLIRALAAAARVELGSALMELQRAGVSGDAALEAQCAQSLGGCYRALESLVTALAEDAERGEEEEERSSGRREVARRGSADLGRPLPLDESSASAVMAAVSESVGDVISLLEAAADFRPDPETQRSGETLGRAYGEARPACDAPASAADGPRRPVDSFAVNPNLLLASARLLGRFGAEAPRAFGGRLRGLLPTLLNLSSSGELPTVGEPAAGAPPPPPWRGYGPALLAAWDAELAGQREPPTGRAVGAGVSRAARPAATVAAPPTAPWLLPLLSQAIRVDRDADNAAAERREAEAWRRTLATPAVLAPLAAATAAAAEAAAWAVTRGAIAAADAQFSLLTEVLLRAGVVEGAAGLGGGGEEVPGTAGRVEPPEALDSSRAYDVRGAEERLEESLRRGLAGLIGTQGPVDRARVAGPRPPADVDGTLLASLRHVLPALARLANHRPAGLDARSGGGWERAPAPLPKRAGRLAGTLAAAAAAAGLTARPPSPAPPAALSLALRAARDAVESAKAGRARPAEDGTTAAEVAAEEALLLRALEALRLASPEFSAVLARAPWLSALASDRPSGARVAATLRALGAAA